MFYYTETCIIIFAFFFFLQSAIQHVATSSKGNFEDLNVSVIKTWTNSDSLFPHEQNIKVVDLLQPNIAGTNCFRGPSDVTLTFDFLMGQGHELSSELKDKLSGILEELDFSIEEKEIEQAMISADF